MPLSPGSRFGPYEIVAPLGVGGMGEVYRARDTKLNRDVAVKVLLPAVANDPDRLARFSREAQVLASLNHPNIGHIHGLEEAGGVTALVLELVEGEDLAQRIARGAIPLDEALPIAKQIAEALEAAHDQGIIHRDLKPANIKVRPDGTVKVLDFGLAKAMEPAGASSVNAMNSPTLSRHATQAGAILGTAAYMSPEQARGQVVNKRTDIWAFGCVLYEMLSGHSPFARPTTSDAIAAVLERAPDWSALPDTVPAGIRHLLRKCLEKDLRQRLRDIGDASIEIDETRSIPVSGRAALPHAARRTRLIWAGAVSAALVTFGLAAAIVFSRDHPARLEAVRLSLSTPGQFFAQPPSAAMSPDGRSVAFVTSDPSGKDMLWVRTLEAREARMLSGTERADLPFWSPDSRFLGFFADGKLKKVDVAGGPVQTLTNAGVSAGATWSDDGRILFASRVLGQFATVSAGGGDAAPVTLTPDASGSWPRFLPDGRHFLYYGGAGRPEAGVYLGSLDSKETKLILKAGFEGSYAPPGYLLFVRDENLFAQPFDTTRFELTGEPQLVAEGVWAAPGYGHAVFSAGSTGALAYVNAAIADTQLVWFDRSGRPLDVKSPPGRYDSPPQISPSGSKVVVARGPLFGQDLWLHDSQNGSESRLTFTPSGNRVPVWSPDGSRIVFQSTRGDGRARLYQKHANGEGLDERLSETPGVNLQDVSPDGRLIVYMVVGASRHFELWVLPLVGDHKPYPFLQTPFNNSQAQVSPDGRWIAYTSTESGRDEVYVQSFPVPGSKRQVSTDGGAQPRWRRTGGELYYLAPDQVLMALAVKSGTLLVTGRPSALFRTRLNFAGTQGPFFMAGYAPSIDGQRFVLNVPAEQPVAPITVVLNWTAALKR